MRRTAEERRAFVETRAAQMAAAPTTAEVRLKELLEPLGFEFQVPICGWTKNGGRWDYVMDAFHFASKLCVEADGSGHRITVGRDRRRGQRLATEHQIYTLRFTNGDIRKRSDRVLRTIKERMAYLGRA